MNKQSFGYATLVTNEILFTVVHQASAYEAYDCTHMPLHTSKTLETCKKKHALFN